MHPSQIRIEDYSYPLPQDRIAIHPVHPRDQARLLVYRGSNIRTSHFHSLADFLPRPSALIFNETRVMPARLIFRKPTGKKIEIFCLEPVGPFPDIEVAMQQKGEIEFWCLVGGIARWKPDQWIPIDEDQGSSHLEARWTQRGAEGVRVLFRWASPETFAALLDRVGRIPIPPYLNRDTEESDQIDYQTVFARKQGSVAAPTAGLHFTPGLMDRLQEKEIIWDFVNLHVGVGTFRPVSAATMSQHEMHAEWMEVSLERLYFIRGLQGKMPCIAVGTTAMRLIESLYWIGLKLGKGYSPLDPGPAVGQWDPYQGMFLEPPEMALDRLIEWMQKTGLERFMVRTQILICPGYPFQLVQGLITNFHQPASTLLLLVAALEKNWRAAYEYALTHDFRFLSYGDGSLFLPDRPLR